MAIVGTGIDIVECLRIAQMIERHGELFITRVYTDIEIEYCTTRKAATQHYAGRWAAKEAVLKALGTGWTRGINWRDIEVRNEMGRVTWPTRREVYATTFVVILRAIFFGVYLWSLDILLNRFVAWIFRTMGAA